MSISLHLLKKLIQICFKCILVYSEVAELTYYESIEKYTNVTLRPKTRELTRQPLTWASERGRWPRHVLQLNNSDKIVIRHVQGSYFVVLETVIVGTAPVRRIKVGAEIPPRLSQCRAVKREITFNNSVICEDNRVELCRKLYTDSKYVSRISRRQPAGSIVQTRLNNGNGELYVNYVRNLGSCLQLAIVQQYLWNCCCKHQDNVSG